MSDSTSAWSKEEFHQQLLERGSAYHIHHPFQMRMNEGKLSKKEMRVWVANRFYYQKVIPLKDAAILSRCDDIAARREWVQRILNHDGVEEGKGGIHSWLKLAEACGLSREEVMNEKHVVPGVRFAVDSYLNFARTRPWQESVCASLTELFAHKAHKARIDAFPVHYAWIKPEGTEYFQKRVGELRRDLQHALELTLDNFTTREQQHRALEILGFKLDILWSMLDAIDLHLERTGRE